MPHADDVILDGAAVVIFLNPKYAQKKINDYALDVLLPYVIGQLQHADRGDVVWDRCCEKSIKSQTKKKAWEGFVKESGGIHHFTRKLAAVLED